MAIIILLGGSGIYGASIGEPDELTPIRGQDFFIAQSSSIFGKFQAEQYKTLWSLKVPFYRKERNVKLTETANGFKIELEDGQGFQFEKRQLLTIPDQNRLEGIAENYTVSIKFLIKNDKEFIDEMHITIGDYSMLLDGKVIHLRNFTRIE